MMPKTSRCIISVLYFTVDFYYSFEMEKILCCKNFCKQEQRNSVCEYNISTRRNVKLFLCMRNHCVEFNWRERVLRWRTCRRGQEVWKHCRWHNCSRFQDNCSIHCMEVLWKDRSHFSWDLSHDVKTPQNYNNYILKIIN